MPLHQELLPSDDDFISQALELIEEHDSSVSFNSHKSGELLVLPTLHDQPLLEGAERTSSRFGSGDIENPLKPRPTIPPLSEKNTTNNQEGLVVQWLREPAAPPRRVNKRRAELNQLRRRVQQLEQRLETLHGQRLSPGDASRVDARRWHAVASAELKRLEGAETENLRLKKLLQEYRHADRQIRRLVTKHFMNMEKDLIPSSKQQTVVEMAPLIQNPALFPLLLDSIWGMQLRTDNILASQHLPTPHGACRNVNTELANGTDISIRIVESRFIPFPFSSVVAATWKQSFELDGIHAVTWEDLGGQTFQGKLNTHADVCMFSGNVQGKVVMRRIDEPDRVVIFRSGQYVCGESTHACQPIWNQQWVAVSKLPTPLANTACQLTTYDICLHMVPPATSLSTATRDERLTNLTQAYVGSSTQRLEKAKGAIDTLLLLRQC